MQRFAALASDYVRSGDAARLAPEINAYYASYGDSVLGGLPVCGQAGAQHVDAVQGGLGGDLIVLAGEGD